MAGGPLVSQINLIHTYNREIRLIKKKNKKKKKFNMMSVSRRILNEREREIPAPQRYTAVGPRSSELRNRR